MPNLDDDFDKYIVPAQPRQPSQPRTDRHNNPIAVAVSSGGKNQYTKALDDTGIAWDYGDPFPANEGGASMRTIRIKGDPYEASRTILANTNAIQGWYSKNTGKTVLPKYGVKTNQDFARLPVEHQNDIINGIYQSEGGRGTLKPSQDDFDKYVSPQAPVQQASSGDEFDKYVNQPPVTDALDKLTNEVNQRTARIQVAPTRTVGTGERLPRGQSVTSALDNLTNDVNNRMARISPQVGVDASVGGLKPQPVIRGQRMSAIPRVASEGVLQGAAGWAQSIETLSEFLPDVLGASSGMPAVIGHALKTANFNPVADKLQEATTALRTAAQKTDTDPATGKPFRDAMSYWKSVPLDVLQAGVKAGFDIPRYVLLTKGLGTIPGFGVEATLSSEDTSTKGRIKSGIGGAATGAAFHGLSKIPGLNTVPRRVASMAGLGAGQSAIEQKINNREVALRPTLSSAITMGGLGSLGGREETGNAREAPSPSKILKPQEGIIPESQQNELRSSFMRDQLAPTANDPRLEPLPVDAEAQARAERIGRTQATLQGNAASPQLRDIPSPIVESPPAEPEGTKLNRWQHRDFGRVTETEDQSGVSKGRVRVIDESGAEHVIQRSNGRGQNNQIAVPLRETTQGRELREQQEANAPYRVIDRRGQPKIQQPEPDNVALDPVIPSGNSVLDNARRTALDQGMEIVKTDEGFTVQKHSGELVADVSTPEEAAKIVEKGATSNVVEKPSSTDTSGTGGGIIARSPKERSFPKTLEASGREGGTDRTYEPITNEETRAKAKQIVDSQGTESAIETFKTDKGSPTKTALGIELIDRLQKEAADHEAKGKDEDAAYKYGLAADVASHAAQRLTEAGQEVQAASIAQRYTPEGALREAARITKKTDTPLSAEQVKATTEIAKRVQASEQRIAELEKTVESLRKGKPRGSGTPKTPRLEKIDVYFDRVAQEAQARIDARTEKAKAELTGPRGERGAGVNPVGVAADIGDYAIIGAAKLAKGGISFAQWSSDMVKDFGEEVRPHLNKIFRESRKLIDDKRAESRAQQQQRLGEREQVMPESIQDTLQRLNAEKAKNRQDKSDLDKHFRQLERDAESHKLDAVLSLTRDSLLSARGLLRILGGMGGKQVLDFNARFVKSGVDIIQSRATGGPRTSAAPSFGTLLRTIGRFAESAPANVRSAVKGEASEVMPNVHGGPTDNPYVNATVGIMQRLYGGKEALIRSWAYPEAQQGNARVFAVNDLRDGIIRRSELDARTKDYIVGRVEFEGANNKRLVSSLADQAADYEVRNKQIIPSMKDIRAKELRESPTELIHSLSLQATDKAVYAQPYESKLARDLGRVGSDSVGGKIAKNIVLPFSKRPANNVADSLFGYTGLRTFKEGAKLIKSRINREFDPAQVRAFNDAVGKGATGFAVMAAGAALAKKGVLISPLDAKHPGALKIRGEYYNISNVPVVGWLLGMGAAYQTDGAKNVPKAFAKMILEHPLLRSAKDISETVGEWKNQGFGKATTKYAGQTAARFVPAPVKIAAEASDTKERVTTGVSGPLRASIPGVRQRLPAYADKSRLSIINPLYQKPSVSQSKILSSLDSTLAKELTRIDKTVEGVSIDKEGGETPQEFEKRKAAINPQIEQDLKDLVDTRMYKQLSDEDKKKQITMHLTKVTKEANENYRLQNNLTKPMKLRQVYIEPPSQPRTVAP